MNCKNFFLLKLLNVALVCALIFLLACNFSAQAQIVSPSKINLKRINVTDFASAKRDFTSLRNGEYSVMKLKLPGSKEETDYYVKREGTKLILNGDIIVCDFGYSNAMSYTRDDETHTFGKDDLYRWPGGVVPVVLDNSVFTDNNYMTIKAALDYFNYNTAIIFKERTNEEEYVTIRCAPSGTSGAGGNSDVGRQRNGTNSINLIVGSFSTGTVLHELMHTLGVWHEQSRQDRDNYIQINWSNIKDESIYNFQQEGNSTAHGAFDYCSIMEYPSAAFAKDNSKPTILCKTNGTVSSCPSCMGQRSTLSAADKAGLDEFYRGIGISRFPCGIPFESSHVPVAGCIGVNDNDIRSKWANNKSVLGDCTSGVTNLGISGGLFTTFQYGAIYKSPLGVYMVYGSIYAFFSKKGGLGQFGFPVSDEKDVTPADGLWSKFGYSRMSRFEKGVILWGSAGTVFKTNEEFKKGPLDLQHIKQHRG